MMKYFLSLVFTVSSGIAVAQSNIVESLQTNFPGQGKVTVHQDAQITDMIGKRFVRTGSSEAQRVIKTRGYRVQVYAGNNSRQARDEANIVAEKVKEKFPDMPVYTFFQPPRWLCRVGDYKSIEEAHVAMRQLKAEGSFKEVAIVREQINIPIE